MSRSKKNLEKFLSKKIHNPPEIFQYESDGYIIMVDILQGEVSVKPSTARVLRNTETNLIMNWIQVSSLPGFWSDWTKYVRPIITYFYISQNIRKGLYRTFRESTQAKLKKTIKEIEKSLKKADAKWQYLFEERKILEARLNGYIRLDEKLKIENAGPNKFLYPIIRPLFEELESLGFTKIEQCKIVFNLYEIGNFDNFNDFIPRYEDGTKQIDYALNRIQKIRTETFKDSFL